MGSEGPGEVWDQGELFQPALGSPFPCQTSLSKAPALHLKFITCVTRPSSLSNTQAEIALTYLRKPGQAVMT